MPVRVQCPSCAAVANLPDSVRGKSIKVTCNKCKTKFPLQAKPAAGGKGSPPASGKPGKSGKPSGAVAAGKAKPSQPKAKPTRDDDDLDFDDEPVVRRKSKGKSRGPNWLLIGSIGGGATLAVVAVVLFLVMRSPTSNPTIAQATNKTTDAKEKPNTPPVDTGNIAPTEKVEPTEKLPPDNGNQPPVKIPEFPNIDNPPDKTPKIEHASKTPDGAMTLTAHPDRNLRFAAISPDGKTLYTAAWDNQLRIWDANTYALKEEIPLPKPDKEVNTRLQAALSHDGKSLVFAHWDVLQIMDLESKKIDVFEGMPGEDHSLGQICLSADGGTAVTNWATVHFALWRVPERKFVGKLQYDSMGLANGHSALTPDGRTWIHAPNNGDGVRLRGLPDANIDQGRCAGKEPVSDFDAISYMPGAPALSAKGNLLAYAQKHKTGRSIRVFDLAKRTMLQEMPLTKFSKEFFDPRVDRIAIAPDETLLVAIDSDRYVHGFDLTTGAFLGAFLIPRSSANGDDDHVVQFTSDGRRLIAAARNFVKIWERDTLVWATP